MAEIQNIVEVKNLTKFFTSEQKFLDRLLSRREPAIIKAVDNISFTIKKGETFGLVGETGSGKTTIGRLVLRLIEKTSGEIFIEGKNIYDFNKNEMKDFRHDARIIFQDPFASLNPRMTVGEIVGLPIEIHTNKNKNEKEELVIDILEKVGLHPATELMQRYPHEFSGGQRQRIGIARSIILNPKFIVADEPVTSLDVSIQAQVLNLLEDLKADFDLTYLLIAHDLSVMRHMSDRVLVLYLGRPMELAPVDILFDKPLHPYTNALLKAVPSADPDIKIEKINLKGEMPSAVNPPKGCRFHTRCPYSKEECIKKEPDFQEVDDGHFVACTHLI
jgi:oligopeptide/dipeptide ABC transporter ATP-binding protein